MRALYLSNKGAKLTGNGLQYVAEAKFEEDVALLMQSTLEPLGFKVTMQPDPWNRVTDLATKLETSPNMSEIFFEATYPSPDSMFFTQYHSKAAGTWASMEWLEDPAIDALIDEARSTGDTAKQAEIYKTLQHKLVYGIVYQIRRYMLKVT